MSILPRKAEVDVVVAVLESDQFDTSAGMAREIVKLVADTLSKRDALGVSLSFAGNPPGLAIGPFYSKRDAEKCAQDAREAGMEARINRLSGTGAIRPVAVLTARFCITCDHRVEMHPNGVCYVNHCDCERLIL